MSHASAQKGAAAGWLVSAWARRGPEPASAGARAAREVGAAQFRVQRGRGFFNGAGISSENAATGAKHRLPFAANAAPSESAIGSPLTVSEQPPPKLSGAEIRERFLNFYERKAHQRMPSSSLVPDDPTVLLTIAGMLQFKPVFLGRAPKRYSRVTTTQKCVRTNDIENVGVTSRHHTFFEMLGNFSFGDYFKKEAIAMAWELSTKELRIPKSRIWVSVYTSDDDALAIWRDDIGVPEERIQRRGEDDNFWASGPTGPCGPCSELYYDNCPEKGTAGADLGDDDRFVEFYNLVFMELDRDAEGKLTPLSAKNIDTGMGLERVAQILQDTPSNYETDLIFPIIQKAAKLANVEYSSADEMTKRALRVMGDHTRAVVYLISDGVRPSNIGRGYVVRRLIRRIVMKGRLQGIKGAFTPALADVAISLSDGCDPAVRKSAQRITTVIAEEEEQFSRTLAAGQKKLHDIVEAYRQPGSSSEVIMSGEDAFVLFDTYGFPLELTQEIAAAEGMQVDVAEFTAQMEIQKQRSKQARGQVDMGAQSTIDSLMGTMGSTEFLGYSQLEGEGKVIALVVEGESRESAGEGAEVELVLDRTPFYAESGGQIGDHGFLRAVGTSGVGIFRVSDVRQGGGGELHVHTGAVESGSIAVGQTVSASVDSLKRQRVKCHHTATHLLQAALKKVLGEDTSQQGSLVDFERLRFDFNAQGAMTESNLDEVERLVNLWIQEAHNLETMTMPLTEAKAAGATAMFGEKYADVVRVVDVPGVSMELCGGTHVKNTSEIGGFKIVSESAIQSGIRRIEAVAGPAVIDYLNNVDKVVRTLKGSLKVEVDKIPERVTALQQDLMGSRKEVEALQKELALVKVEALAGQSITLDGGASLLVADLDGVDGKSMQEAAQKLLDGMGDPAAVLLGSAGAGRVSLVAGFSPAVVSGGLQAGKFVGGIAKICGGGGGGRPNLAQAGGRQPEKLEEALKAGRSQLTEALNLLPS
ncbi:unnamed protein product [Ostreobium quekettii]|uniref:Alanine--tRNA ligase n=1 Tax=Ostreobium quekettii TaxID=121088 RepID=A0A8S1IUU7_9CHLO|nr:unnamed protein product [Ostreobium quekettii]|eukprot:evm.model.scf_210.9 EVM.evm.TU.scf_210.9   scf_210:99049-110552(-)